MTDPANDYASLVTLIIIAIAIWTDDHRREMAKLRRHKPKAYLGEVVPGRLGEVDVNAPAHRSPR